jgi:hypothetical protein
MAATKAIDGLDRWVGEGAWRQDQERRRIRGRRKVQPAGIRSSNGVITV